ncbi:hypothetical protein KBY90_13995 [Cyanobium sp. CH-040]|nr:hypothetical protein [Cyanobium sp. CH-040]
MSGPLLAAPARAGLLRPVLELMRPQLETRISRACVDGLAGDDPQLASQLQRPCRQLAAPASRCLVRETDASGKGLAVLGELMQQELGPEGERIVKRCLAQLVGLPANSLEGVSLPQLVQRFGGSRRGRPAAEARR